MAQKTVKALLEAIRQGSIRNLTYVEQARVVNAVQVIKALPDSFDEVHIEAKVGERKDD